MKEILDLLVLEVRGDMRQSELLRLIAVAKVIAAQTTPSTT